MLHVYICNCTYIIKIKSDGVKIKGKINEKVQFTINIFYLRHGICFIFN